MATVALVGTGFIGRVHARSARLAGAELAGVAASTPERAAAAARELGAPRSWSSPEAVAAEPEVDVVHVCTPNHLHVPYVRAAIAAGKHVICEKPLAPTLAEARELRDLADAAGVTATIPFVYRFHPMAREMASRVRSGALGTIRLVHGGYLQDWLVDPATENWRLDPALGGRSRAFADVGSHWCDLMEWAGGDRIARLSARLRRRGETEDAATISFETASGATGHLLVSQISYGHKNRLLVEFDGTEASVRFDQQEPDVLQVADARGDLVLHRGDPALSAASHELDLVPPGHPQGYTDAFAQFVAHSYRAMAGDPPDGLPTFADGVRSARLVEAVLASAENRAWVEVGTEEEDT